jgi:molecular chaperone Hsp33
MTADPSALPGPSGLDDSPGGVLITGLLCDRTVRFLAVDARGIAGQLAAFHDLRPNAARVAAESTVATVLMSAHIKGDQRITLQIQSKEPELAFTADVDSTGGFRGRLTPSRLRVGPKARIDGILFAIKSDLERELYRGMTALEKQTIEEALSGYLQNSAQVATVLRLGAEVDAGRIVQFAGGYLFERLPGEEDHTFGDALAELQAQPLGEVLDSLLLGRAQGLDLEVMERRSLHWRCSCGQERIEAVLLNLGPSELQAMLTEDGKAEVVCHFCNIAYQVSGERLKAMIAQFDEA